MIAEMWTVTHASGAIIFLKSGERWRGGGGGTPAGTLVGKVGTHVCSSVSFQEIVREKVPFFAMKSRNF